MKKFYSFLGFALLGSVGFAQVYTVGSGSTTTTSTIDSPFGTFYMDDRTQLLYTAADMAAAGATAGSISAIGFNVSSVGSPAMNSLKIGVGFSTTTTSMFGYTTATITQVYQNTGSYTPTSGWNTFTLNTPIIWNGTDNIIIDVCYDNSSWITTSGVYADYNSTPKVYSLYQDISAGTLCGTTSGFGGTGYYRAQARFTILPLYANDAGISEILSPSLPTCDLDSLDITVVLQNLGNDTLSNCSIKYQINSGSIVSYYYTGSVMPSGGTDTVVLGNSSFSNADALVVWTELPNGVNDSLGFNDTNAMVVATGLAGTYNVPNDFPTLTLAATALNTFGVCDHVTIELDNGTYTEQVTLGDVLGVSEDATITFTSASGNYGDVVVQYASTGSTNNWVFWLNNTDWVTISDMTLKATGTSIYGNLVKMTNGASNNTVDGCWMKSVNSGTTGAGDYQSAVMITGASNNNTITNNRIEKGNSPIYAYGTSTASRIDGLTIEGNTIEDMAYYGNYLWYINNLEFNNNRMLHDSTTLYGYVYMGNYVYYVDNFNINNNYIGFSSCYYGLYMGYCVGSANPKSSFANNCINLGNSTSTSYNYYPLYMFSSGNINFYHNSIQRRGITGTYYTAYFNGGAIDIKNNSFADHSGGYAFYVNGVFTINESNYNNLYTTGQNVVYFGSSPYQSMEAYQTATGQDMSSVQTDPNFQTDFDCITCNDTLNNGGMVLNTITEDIGGSTRSVITPDIGPMEFVTPQTFTLGPDTTYCGSTRVIEAGPAQSISWNVDGTTSSDPSVTLFAAGGTPESFTVTVNIVTEYCGSGSDLAIIELVPDAELDSNYHLCAGETEVLSAGGGTTATYMWNTSDVTQTITVDGPGVYSVTKDELGCTSTASTVVTQSTAVDIADFEACAADGPVSVNATIPSGTSYAWSGGSSLNTAINTLTASGTYQVTATDAFGCSSDDEFSLLVLDVPVAAITYVSGGAVGYQFYSNTSQQIGANTTYSWLFNGIDPSTQANPIYFFPWSSTPVTYPVFLAVDNGCGVDEVELSITLDPLSVGDVAAASGISLYPNPASDAVVVAQLSDFNDATITVVDQSGRTMKSESGVKGTQHSINVESLSAGTYFIKIENSTQSSVLPLVVH